MTDFGLNRVQMGGGVWRAPAQRIGPSGIHPLTRGFCKASAAKGGFCQHAFMKVRVASGTRSGSGTVLTGSIETYIEKGEAMKTMNLHCLHRFNFIAFITHKTPRGNTPLSKVPE